MLARIFTLCFTCLTCSCGLESMDKRSETCYGDLGCFSTGGVFTDINRILNVAPESPYSINTRFLLFTRQNQDRKSVQYINPDEDLSIAESLFNASKPTKCIIHGFIENGLALWLQDMKDELLTYGDYNVILVDWGHGSSLPYTQATANTRVVGAVVAKFIRKLQAQTGARVEDVHLIGHSLGAHICGYAGERTPGLGRISGLDPAEPYFQYTDPAVRLDPTDAAFVDVIHTDGESILSLGYGMKQSCGHVDYFPNNGESQPGCERNPIDTLLLEGDIYEGAKHIVACSHIRAIELFSESINAKCPFAGYSCSNYDDFSRGMCLPCTGTSCGYMGFHADREKPKTTDGHKEYYLETGYLKPFCRYHYQVDVSFGDLAGTKSETGTLYLNLVGSQGQTGEQQVTTDPLDIQPGHKYGFMLLTSNDLGDISKVDFRWQVDYHWYNPLTWSLITHHALQVDSLEVVNGETEAMKTICGFNAEVNTDEMQSFSLSC